MVVKYCHQKTASPATVKIRFDRGLLFNQKEEESVRKKILWTLALCY